ncbi:protein-L-isoaspartate O-methyltransferase [Patescibacteria group bacterium]|nr:MAG: protein-L-isoaspartate O-methyltransferase [Patescibacteria group bacterium]
MSRLVNNLIRTGYLKSDPIIDAFSEMHRLEFVPEELESEAEANIPLPIGYGQTISQPLTVAFMLELLDPQAGQNILDVGSGSGWTTALLSYIVRAEGKVTALEVIPELCEVGKYNVNKFGFVKKGIAEFHCIDGTDGFAAKAPYDRILVSAMADDVPIELKNQLKVGGKMVIPVHNNIWYLERRAEDDFYKEEYPGFDFVPLVRVARS